MTAVYKAITLRQDLVAFWKSGPSTMSFFIPSARDESFFSASVDDWNSTRTHYEASDHLDLYDEDINAAWHLLGQRMEFIDRRAVMISDVEPGIYYPRIWRGYYPDQDPFMGYNAVNPRKIYGYRYTQSAAAAASLFSYLVEIFRHVEPSEKNYQTFGHKMRELLLLACTEIESEWRAVLEENTKKENWQERYTTADYFRVKEPLRLGEWGVILTDYPQLNSFMTFETWTQDAPTKSLAWYDAYNAVKHHRVSEFSKATLGNLIDAMAALHIMQAAQWGPEVFSLLHDNRSSPFTVIKSPNISINEIYMPSIDENRNLVAGLYFDR
jgi:hypothetical protein